MLQTTTSLCAWQLIGCQQYAAIACLHAHLTRAWLLSTPRVPDCHLMLQVRQSASSQRKTCPSYDA